MANKYKHIHAGTVLLFHLISIVLLAVSLSFFSNIFWYKINVFNVAKTYYSGKHICTDLPVLGYECNKHNDNHSHALHVVMLSFYLAIAGLVASCLVIGTIMIQYMCHKCITHLVKTVMGILYLLFSFLAILFDFLAFGLFFRITNGKNATTEWGAGEGLWICLTAGILCVICFIITFRGAKPEKYSRIG